MATVRFVGSRVQLASFHGTRLMAHEDGRVLGSPNHREWETWSVEDAGDGAVFLVSAHGLALRSEPGGAVDTTTARLGYERWRFEPSGEGDAWFLRSAEHGLDLSMDPEGRVCTKANRQSWERFTVAVVRPTLARHASKVLIAIVGAGARRLAAAPGGPTLAYGSGPERWSVEDAGEGLVRLVGPAGALGRAADGRLVFGAGGEARWAIDRLGADAWSIASVATLERLAVGEDGTVGLADTIGEAARWRLEFAAPPHAGRRVHLRSAHDTRLAARPDGGVVATNDDPAQGGWELEDLGDGELALRSRHGAWLSGRPDGATGLADAVGPWERWTALAADDGRVMLRSVAHGRQLQATPEGSVALTPNRLAWEQWRLEPLPSRFVGRVVVLVADGRALGAMPDGSVRLTEAQRELERWAVEDAGDGAVYLVSAAGRALAVTQDAWLRDEPGRAATQRWTIREVEPGRFRVTSAANGLHLAMRNDDPLSSLLSENTLWSIVERPRTTVVSDSFVDRRIVLSSSHGARLVRTPDGVASARDDGPASVWTLTRRPGGHYHLIAADGAALTAERGGEVRVAPAGDDPTQSWSIEQISPGVFALTTWFGRNLQARPDGRLATHTNTALWEWWRLELAPEAPAWPPVGRRVMLTSHHDTRLSVTPEGVVSTTSNARTWESWGLEDAGAGQVFLVSHHGTLLSSKPDGALWVTRNRQAWERWQIQATPSGRCILRSVAHDRWLRAWPDAPPDTAPAAQAYEQWRLDPALVGPLYPGQGEWGKPSALAAADARRALTGSPLELASQVLRRIVERDVLPMLARLQDLFTGAVADTLEAALAEGQALAEALQATAGAAARSLLDGLVASPVFAALVDDRSYAISSPLGRIELVKRGPTLGVHLALRGPGGLQGRVGVANGDPLCAHDRERMANPLLQPIAFVDLELGRSHIHARAPLGGQQVSVTGEHFFKVGEQWMRARFGVLDPRARTVEAGLEIGLKAGVSLKIEAELSARVKVQVSTNPLAAAAALRTLGEALVAAAGDEGITLRDGGSPQQVARALSRALAALAATVSPDEAAELGALTLAVELEGKLGLGVAENVLPFLTATGSASHSLPFLALSRLNADVLAAFLEAAGGLGGAVGRLGGGRLLNASPAVVAEVAEQVAARGRAFAAVLWAALKDYLEGATVGLAFQVDALGEKKSAGAGETSGGSTSMSFTLFSAGIDLPIGAAIARLVEDPALLRRAADAALAIASELAPQLGAWQDEAVQAAARAPAPIDWESLALGTGDATRLSFAVGVTAAARVTFAAPALPLIQALHGAAVEARAVLHAAVRSARDGSLDPLRAAFDGLAGRLGAAAGPLLAACEVGLVVGGGVNFSLGLQVDAEFGLGASFTAKTTPGLLLLLASAGRLRVGAATGGMVMGVAGSLSGGFSLGVGGKLDGKLALEGQASLLSFDLQAWDDALPPPADLRVAGFEVIDFSGDAGRDGALDGRGTLVLPTGGTVAAAFTTDPAGHVLRGSWSADLEIGEHRLAITGGALDDAGLHGRVGLSVAGVQASFDLSLTASGEAQLRHASDLEVGGVSIASTRLHLTPDGFEGSGRLAVPDVLGAEVSLRTRGNGDFHAKARGEIMLHGRTLSAADLSVSAHDLGDEAARAALSEVFRGQTPLPAYPRRVAFVSGSARLDVLGAAHQFKIKLVPALGLADISAETSVEAFGLTISEVLLRLDHRGLGGTGRLRLGDVDLACALSFGPDGAVSVTGRGELQFLGERLSYSVTLGADGLHGTVRTFLGAMNLAISRTGQLRIWP